MIEKIVLLSGPTATGKSSLASKLAEKIDGEIINADSIQLYRDLFILTARPDIEKEKIKHHCYGFLDGDINWSVGKWINEINKILKDVIKRKNVISKGELKNGHILVATKYKKIVTEFFADKGIRAECIKLNGAIELAPKLEICSTIVDLVSTGRTIKENSLEESKILMRDENDVMRSCGK